MSDSLPKRYRLKKIRIQGIKSIRDSEFELGPVNLVVGPNGSGKSNLIKSFKLIRYRVAFTSDNAFTRREGGASKILHFGRKRTSSATITFWPEKLNANSDSIKTEFLFEPTLTDQLKFVDQKILSDTLPLEELYQAGDQLTLFIDNISQYHFHDTSDESTLKSTSNIKDFRHLNNDGSNLPAFLYRLKNYYPESYSAIVHTVRRIAPFFAGFILEPYPETDTIRLLWKHTQSDNDFDVSDFSDGTLRFIALATVLLQPDATIPPLILLDEPELGLHPYALQLLAGLIKSASTHTQIIAATQSVTLLNQFGWQDLVIADSQDGVSSFRRPDEAEAKTWLEDYALGNLWEENWFGGTPGWRAV